MVFVNAGPAFSSIAFYHYGIENGLPESKIVSISQDSTGFIWLAGENGLFRFDGIRFDIYQNTFSDGEPESFTRINTLFTDSQGTLWVGSANGLSRFNPQFNQFVKPAEDLTDQPVFDIFEDSNGQIWLASDAGLAKFDPSAKKTTWFSEIFQETKTDTANLLSVYIQHITGQPDGKLWLSTFPAGLYLFNPVTGETENFSQIGETDFSKYNISKIYFNNESLFVGTLLNGFFEVDTKNQAVKNERIDGLANAILHFTQLNDSVFWIATNNGLFQYNNFSGNYTRCTNEPNNPLSLNRTTVSFVYTDRDNNLWLSLGIRGINFGLTDAPFSHFTVAPEGAYQLENKEVTSIEFDTDGNMWLGYEAGLIEKHSYDPLQKIQYQLKLDNQSTQPGSVMAIHSDSKNRVWAGGWMSGLHVLYPGRSAFEQAKIQPETVASQVKTADIRGFAEDRKGNIWISLHGLGLGKYNPERQTLKLYRNNPENLFSSLSNDYTYNLSFDQNQHLWIASAHGIGKFNPETETFTNFFHDENNPQTLNSNAVQVVICDDAGVVWAATDKGLNVYSPALENFLPVFTEKDFPFLTISSIQSAQPGELWVSTTNGIFRIDYEWNENQTEMAVKSSYFNRSDGLLSSNYFARSGAVSNDGMVFFGGNEGIDIFNPSDVGKYNESKTKVLITEIWIDGEPTYPDQFANEDNKINLTLNHNHSILSVRFTALGFSNLGIKNFRYKLEGVQDDWVYLHNEQAASFTHLPPGNFVFRVETQQKNGEWTASESALEIFVERPFWLSVPFYTFLLIALILTIYFITLARSKVLIIRQKKLKRIIKDRTQELMRKNKELEIANQTKDKFFSIISHDLRSPFSGLLGVLDLLTNPDNDFDTPTQKDLLQSAKSSAHNTFELLENLLLWARSQMRTNTTSVKKQNLSDVLKKNLNLKMQFAAQKQVTISGEFPEDLEALFDREMINTVIRNILSNAIKFTPPGGKVNLSASSKNGEITVSIADTGIGISDTEAEKLFDLNKIHRTGTRGEKGTGLGLVICKEFIQNNKGRIWAEPNSPEGTIFHFTLPASQN